MMTFLLTLTFYEGVQLFSELPDQKRAKYQCTLYSIFLIILKKHQMLFEKEYRWANKHFTHRIRQIHCAYNETFVLYEKGTPKHKGSIKQVDKHGTVLLSYPVEDDSSFLMINDYQVLVQEKDMTSIINLKEKHDEFKRISTIRDDRRGAPINFHCFFFKETKLVCLLFQDAIFHQKSPQERDYVYVYKCFAVYYRIHNNELLEESRPYFSLTENTTHVFQKYSLLMNKVFQADQYSSVIIFEPGYCSKRGCIEFIRITKDSRKTFSCKVNTEIDMSSVWIKNEYEYIIVSRSKQRIFIANVVDKSIKESTYFEERKRQLLWPKSFFMDEFIVIQDILGNQRFYIYNYEIERIPRIKFQKYPVFHASSYDGSLLTSRSRTKTEMIVKKVRLTSMRDEYMQMLLHLNEDFDDDILLDAMNILGFK